MALSRHWEHFEHQADIGVRGIGGTPSEAFEEAAAAMMAVMVDAGAVAEAEEVEIRCSAPDLELLLADWLNALLCEVSARKMLFRRFSATVKDGVLTGRAWGERIDPRRHRPVVEVKGASYFGLKVAQMEDGRWMAQCVVDV